MLIYIYIYINWCWYIKTEGQKIWRSHRNFGFLPGSSHHPRHPRGQHTGWSGPGSQVFHPALAIFGFFICISSAILKCSIFVQTSRNPAILETQKQLFQNPFSYSYPFILQISLVLGFSRSHHHPFPVLQSSPATALGPNWDPGIRQVSSASWFMTTRRLATRRRAWVWDPFLTDEKIQAGQSRSWQLHW